MQPQTIEDEDDGNVKRHSAISVLLAASQTPGVGRGGVELGVQGTPGGGFFLRR